MMYEGFTECDNILVIMLDEYQWFLTRGMMADREKELADILTGRTGW